MDLFSYGDPELAYDIAQWFPNFPGARTTQIILVLHEAQNIDLSRTTA